jgi:hypothetical protein
MTTNKILIGSALILGTIPFLASGQTEKFLATVSFSQIMTVEDALSVAMDNELDPIFLEHEFTVPGRLKSVGFIPMTKGMSAAEEYKKAKDAHRAFLQDMAAGNDEEAPAFKKALQKPSDIKITKMMVESRGELLNVLKKKDSRIKEVDVKKSEQKSPKLESFLKRFIETAVAAVSQESWVPEYGKIQTSESSVAGERYVRQKLHWDDASGFGLKDTFEPDFFTYNYDGTTKSYLDKRETTNNYPVTTYTSSDLPGAYLDTRSFDAKNSNGERNELAYTIGSSRADDIKIGYTYVNYIRTVKGAATTDKGKLQMQRGYRYPSTCYTTWCSFGYENDSSSRYKPVTSWSISVPGYLEWRK